MSSKYEVAVGPSAIRTLLNMTDLDRKEIAEALRTELVNGPNADKEYSFEARLDAAAPDNGKVYTGTPLSYGGYVAVHRPMTTEELERLRREQGRRRVAAQGFHVFDILHAAMAFTPLPRLVGHI
jgi:hypothetical protein